MQNNDFDITNIEKESLKGINDIVNEVRSIPFVERSIEEYFVETDRKIIEANGRLYTEEEAYALAEEAKRWVRNGK